MTAKKSFVFNFAQPSYMNDNNNPSLEDTTTDPIFKVTSKKPYRPEVTTRSTTWDYFRTSLLLPSASEVLNALGRGIEEIDQLLCDGRVKACFNNRRAGTMSLKWTIDRNNAPSRMFKVIDKMFQQLPVQDIMSEMLLASFYGYAVSEVIWEYDGGLWLPTNVTGKPVRWFGWSELNELRYKTKVQMVQGEPLPPRKFLATRFHATYGDPASSREALFNGCYWPVKFRHMVLEYGIRFLEKYGSPWLDVKMETGLQEERLNEILTVLQNTFQDGIVAHPDNTEITALAVGDSKSVQNYIDWMDILNREIDMCILGNNMSAEIKGGSYAAATALAGVRDDIIKEDCRMVETSMNQLIEWICWYNWPATTDLPKFRLYKSEPPTKERADIDTALKAMGVTFKKEYFTRTYGLDEEEFDLAEPVQMQTVVGPDGLPKQVPMPGAGAVVGTDGQLDASTTQTITDEGIETKDVSSNSQTKQAIAKSQAKGSNYSDSAPKNA